MTNLIRTLVLVVSIGLAGSASADPGQVLPGAGLSAYDANGKLLGPVSINREDGTSGIVSVKVGNTAFSLVVTRNILRGNRNEVLMYTSSNCTGQPYLAHDFNDGVEPLLRGVAAQGGSVWVTNGPAVMIVDQSNFEIPGGPCNSYPTNSEERLANPAEQVTDTLDLQYVPPYSVR